MGARDPCCILRLNCVEVFLLRLGLEKSWKEISRDNFRDSIGVCLFVKHFLRSFYTLRGRGHKLRIGWALDERLGRSGMHIFSAVVMVEDVATLPVLVEAEWQEKS